MRRSRLAASLSAAAAMGVLLACSSALAQAPAANDGARPGNVIGTGQSLPLSNKASNIAGADTASSIAPRLPTPSIGEDAPPAAYLRAAAQALAAGRTGEAQEAMERAESRALDRSVRPSQSNIPDQQPLVQQIAAARSALAVGDRARSLRLLQIALHDPQAGGQPK